MSDEQTTQQTFYADIKKLKLGEKIYLDKDGNQFKLADLCIDEEDEFNALMKIDASGIQISEQGTKRMLALALTPVDKNKPLNPGRLNPKTAVEVLHDFLLIQKEKEFDLLNYTSTFTSGLKKYTKATRNSEDSNLNSMSPN